MAKKKSDDGSDQGVDFDGDEEGSVDLSGVDENAQFPVMPQSVYPVVVDSVEYGTSQRSGNKQLAWQFIVQGAEDPSHNGVRLYFYTVLEGEEATLARTKKAFMAVCPELLSGPFNPEEVANSGELVGRKARAKVGINTYQGRKRNNVREILPAGDGDGGNFL